MIVRLERTFAAPPHEVYRAWLDPELVRRWMAPGDVRLTRVEIDERVGGRYRIWSGPAGWFDCELVALVPDRRLVFRWGFVGPDRDSGPAYDSLLTVTLHEAAGGGTTLILVHERLDDLAEVMPDVADNVGPGWELALDRLGGTVG
jgi:uncharacterized protein YndB with AHSA1/START domain